MKKVKPPIKSKIKHRFPKQLPEDAATAAPPIVRLHVPIEDMTSEQYHASPNSYSSSQLKDLLDDEVTFIKKHVTKEIEREDLPAFGTGTYMHTGVLEPHKLEVDCAVYPGKIRRGEKWKRFQAKNKGKTIITSAQRDQGEQLIKLVKDSPIAMDYIESSAPEVSLFVEIAIQDDEIYAPYFNKMLTREGWVESDGFYPNLPYEAFIIKVRADAIGQHFILDLKSTTGNARSQNSMRAKISYYNYDLSASLYLDLFSLVNPSLKKFVWTFASKDFLNCRTHRATPKNILVGRAKWSTAIKRLAKLRKKGWEVRDTEGELEPLNYELEWIEQKETDLI